MESDSSCAPQAKAQSPPPMAQAPKPTGVIIKSEFPSLRVCIYPPTIYFVSFYDERSALAVSRGVKRGRLKPAPTKRWRSVARLRFRDRGMFSDTRMRVSFMRADNRASRL